MNPEYSDALTPAACEKARLSRDSRFDGRFFLGVPSTGIYCRPVCPAQPGPGATLQYFDSAARAASAGFRPCLRCRPELAVGTDRRLQSGLVAAAMEWIDRGFLDHNDQSVLAARLGVSARHLTRLFRDAAGCTPGEVAAHRRLMLAKQLISDTDLPFAQVAGAAGYASVRRFNSAVKAVWGRSPSQLRGRSVLLRGLTLRLPLAGPFDGDASFDFFRLRAVRGVETVETTQDSYRYRRCFRLGSNQGVFEVTYQRGEDHLCLMITTAALPVVAEVVARVRRQFDLSMTPAHLVPALSGCPLMGPLLQRSPGIRLPGAFDPFEVAVRGILGQQVTVKAAITLLHRVVDRFGLDFNDPQGVLSRLFPGPEQLCDAPLEELGIIRRRAETIRTLSREILAGAPLLDPTLPAVERRGQWLALPGIGPWTADYIAMRGFGEPDVFPAADIGLLRSASHFLGREQRLKPAELENLSADWGPWRAYAAILLWRLDPLFKGD